ncbi:hypothetical protein BB561_001084 [Smittium simulii]|uniref:Uncharacterized protein n=1 Tax=Smittium simulii TaxID=133385 RepID=A0A2T9YW75_9FUNG|nr:hypothetical protein BB561_001084 [Smittium simulii]
MKKNSAKKPQASMDSTDDLQTESSSQSSAKSQAQVVTFKGSYSEVTSKTSDAVILDSDLNLSRDISEIEHDTHSLTSSKNDSTISNRRESYNDSTQEDDDTNDSIDLEGTEDVRTRQEAINRSHMFGLPIWKPALYKKSRSVTKAAFMALHSQPKRFKRLILNPGNLFWFLLFGFPIGVLIIFLAITLRIFPFGGKAYSRVLWELGWYVMWPFGRVVERFKNLPTSQNSSTDLPIPNINNYSINIQENISETTMSAAQPALDHSTSSSEFSSDNIQTSLLPKIISSYTPRRAGFIGLMVYYTMLVFIINPLLLLTSGIMWLAVFSIPMANLTFTLSKYLWRDPLSLHFRVKHISPIELSSNDPPSKPSIFDKLFPDDEENDQDLNINNLHYLSLPTTNFPESTEVGKNVNNSDETLEFYKQSPNVLLCTNEAFGICYYKYTVDGVNIIFINLLFFALFVLFLAFIIRPMAGPDYFFTQPGVLFLFCLVSTIPLAYFIGQAVSSISAQSSLGIGSVINATFGSIIEIILYSLALTQGKLKIVQGALVGSFLAGMLLMPGTSMIAGGIKYKEQRFNAKSAGVTATLIIMSMIAAFAPTLFYNTFGEWELKCDIKSSTDTKPKVIIGKCFQIAVQPINDPFYLETVRPFTYICAAILMISYIIGLWFTLRTHTKQIYHSSTTDAEQNAGFWKMIKRIINLEKQNNYHVNQHNSSIYSEYINLQNNDNKTTKENIQVLNQKNYNALPSKHDALSFSQKNLNDMQNAESQVESCSGVNINLSCSNKRACMKKDTNKLENTFKLAKSSSSHAKDLRKKGNISTNTNHKGKNVSNNNFSQIEDHIPTIYAADPDDQFSNANIVELTKKLVLSKTNLTPIYSNESREISASRESGDNGHDSPNWSKTKSAVVLCFCTIVFALIAEILVDTVDVVISDFGVSEKMLGLTLFALVPTVTEFVNACAFAMQKNIELAIEICNAYTVQVFLLQIPVLLFFCAYFQDSIIAHSIALKKSTATSAISQLALQEGLTIPKEKIAKEIFGHLRPSKVLSSILAKFGIFASPNEYLVASGSTDTTINVIKQVKHVLEAVNEDREPHNYIFTLIFSRWEIISSVLSMFLLTYMLIEADKPTSFSFGGFGAKPEAASKTDANAASNTTFGAGTTNSFGSFGAPSSFGSSSLFGAKPSVGADGTDTTANKSIFGAVKTDAAGSSNTASLFGAGVKTDTGNSFGGMFQGANSNTASLGGAGASGTNVAGAGLFGTTSQTKFNFDSTKPASTTSNTNASATGAGLLQNQNKFGFGPLSTNSTAPASGTLPGLNFNSENTASNAQSTGNLFGNSFGQSKVEKPSAGQQEAKSGGLFGTTSSMAPKSDALSGNSANSNNLFTATDTKSTAPSNNPPNLSTTFGFSKTQGATNTSIPSSSTGAFTLNSGASLGLNASNKPNNSSSTSMFGSNAKSNLFGNQADISSSITTGAAKTDSSAPATLSNILQTNESKNDTKPASGATGTLNLSSAVATSTNNFKADVSQQKNIKDTVADISTSLLECNTLGDIIDNWTKELTEQIKLFHNQAAKVSNCELQLIQQGEQLTKLYELSSKAEVEHTVLDQSLDFMEAQQQTLIDLLDAYEPITKELVNQAGNNANTKQIGNQSGIRRGETSFGSALAIESSVSTVEDERDEIYSNAERLNAQIDEISKCLTGLVGEANKISELSSIIPLDIEAYADTETNPDDQNSGTSKDQNRNLGDASGGRDPILVISKILNAHLTTLENLESQTSSLEERIHHTELNRSRSNDDYINYQQPPVRSKQLEIDNEDQEYTNSSMMGSVRKSANYDLLDRSRNGIGGITNNRDYGDIPSGKNNLAFARSNAYARRTLDSTVKNRAASYSSPFATRSTTFTQNADPRTTRDFTPLNQHSSNQNFGNSSFNNSLSMAASRNLGPSKLNSSPFQKSLQHMSTPNKNFSGYDSNSNLNSQLRGRFGSSTNSRNWM